jgi:hypothetical protein
MLTLDTLTQTYTALLSRHGQPFVLSLTRAAHGAPRRAGEIEQADGAIERAARHA